jgi:rod shape-determining protein MreD
MNKGFLTYSLLIILPLLQITIFNNVDLLGYVDPYFYLVFIIVFPFKSDKTTLLLSSFFIGLTIDIFTNDGGIHAFSFVFVAYVRAFVLRVITAKPASELNLREVSFVNLFIWVSVLSLIHGFLLFSLEQLSFHNFSALMIKLVISSLLNVMIILMSLELFYKRKG